MRLLPLVLCLVGLGIARADEKSPWSSYDAAIRSARTSHELVYVLYGNPSCPYVGPVQEALDSATVEALSNGRFTRAYVDIDSSGKALAKRWHIVGTPTLQFLDLDGKEVWRITPTAQPAELAAALQQVIDGKSYAGQVRLLRAGTLDPRPTLELARNYLDRGWHRKGMSLLSKIAKDPVRFDRRIRREASFYVMEYATPEQRLRLLPTHIAAFPEDVLARINLGYATRNQSLDQRRPVMRQLADALPLSEDSGTTRAGLRLIVQFALYSDPSSAAWALPFAFQRLSLEPRDMSALSECIAVAVTANRRDMITTAERVALEANASGETSIEDAVAAGIKQGEKAAH